eukprot:UN24766
MTALGAVDTCGRWYDLATNIKPRQWFGVKDIGSRFGVAIMSFYYFLITCPISFAYFTLEYSKLWFSTEFGGIFYFIDVISPYVCFFAIPLMPLILFLCECYKLIKRKYFPQEDWSTNSPGSVFFVPPPTIIGALLWNTYLQLSMYVALFFATGCDSQAIKASWTDSVTIKTFWRDLFRKSNVRCPKEIGFWSNGELEIKHKLDGDLVMKRTDSFLGIGDHHLVFGKDFQTQDDILKFCEKEYEGKDVVILEKISPDKDLGVHSLDILTINTADGPKILSCLLWGHCTGWSSHSSQAGYVVDVESETVIGTTAWYSPYFAT